MTPKILIADIETAPNLAHVWGLWNQNVGLPQIIQPGRMIAVGSKWHGAKNTMFFSEFHDEGGHEEMTRKTHGILDEADIIVHYNGKKFDVPWMRTEFAKYGMKPPSPFKEVDLYQVVSRQFKLPSNKLAYVAKFFGLTPKKQHEGHELWVKCMAGDPKAWSTMRSYCKQDVNTTEELYDRILGWIPSHPHVGLYNVDASETPVCGNCGSERLQGRGYATTRLGKYPRYQCQACGRWSQGQRSVDQVTVRPTVT